MNTLACVHGKITFRVFHSLLLISFLAGTCFSVRAEVKPNTLFSAGVVLQQGIPLPVWGTAGDGEVVTVKFQNQTVITTAKDGHWMLYLKPLKAGGPFVMTIAGKNTVTISNVLIGEVWLCSGQSNMSMPLSGVTNASQAIAAAHDPEFRFFTVTVGASDEPKTELSGAWKEAAPETAKNFSAVAYFFGRDLRKALKVPIGLIHSSVPGTPAEAWTARPVLERNPLLKQILERHEQAIKNYDSVKAEGQHEAAVAKNPAASNERPSSLYNMMIAPLQPFGLAGVIWYQGEQNNDRAIEYRTLFPAMIRNWRDAWGEGEFPFLFVQIAPHRDITPEIRETQFLTWQEVPRTAMAVITDVGEENNIHPTRKEPVGVRLALAARAIAYGEKLEYSEPVYDSMKVKYNHVIVTFTHAGGVLVASGELKGFTLAGKDGKFVSAAATINGNKVIIFSPLISKPVAVRYGWANAPDVNLFNRQGLPATPFRTDVKSL